MGLSQIFLWPCLVAVAVYAIWIILQKLLEYKKQCDEIMKLPGLPPRTRIFGHLCELPRIPNDEMLEGLIAVLQSWPRINYGFIGPFPTVSLSHPETAKEILKTSEPKPLTMGTAYNTVLPWLGEGLLVSGGSKWSRHRKLLTPAFHFDILKPYVKVNNACTETMMNKLESVKEEYFEVFNTVCMCTFDIITQCAFSYKTDCQREGNKHPYVKAVSEITAALPLRMLNPFFYFYPIYAMSSSGRQFRKNCNYVHKISDEVIKARRQALGAEPPSGTREKRYLDFLDILLTAEDFTGSGLSDADIRQEVDTFLFEGHDTTASGIAWTLYSLANNQDCLKKCQDEIDQILEGRGSDEVLWGDLGELKYLTLCIKESLRMHAPVPFIQRITTKDCTIDGFQIPKSTIITMIVYAIMNNPTVWENPKEFIPERFSPENIEKMGSHAFIPFSAGPRNCIGQHFAMHEMKIVVARLIRRFDLELKPGHKVTHVIQTVMRAENGIYMKATPRQTH